MMSRSITRAAQFWPRRRPKSRSMRLSRANSAGGDSALSISATALAKRRFDGPSGGVSRTGETATTPPSAASAAASSRRGPPWRPGRFDPSAIA
ncbi:hypothetical protein TS85_21630 [Sphingomonas hengshuiensis]|uniref:Uncharacterized protein n=1 Tax=Sphingomonas hengshuiensis TaxID=1609977 RepID=A0A7U4JBL9_9SPHN|nr:hypothetical protein TS85_21630 [Sphingomonas hengshuiensis]